MLTRLKIALRALLRKRQAERELDDELRHHIERQTEQNLRLGMNPEEARYAARKAFGGVEQAKEWSRDVRGARWLEEFWQDLRYGARSLLRNPSFSITAIGILAIGIGANTAIFSVVYAVILRPLPYAGSERLVMIEEDWPAKGIQDIEASLPDFLEWRNRNTVFERLEAFSAERYDISSGSGDSHPERVAGAQLSAELFPFLGVAPAQGRRFLGEEQQFGRHRVAILSDSLWRRRFGDQTRLDGQSIKINGEIFIIVGVMPDGFHFPERETQIWVPLSLTAGDNTRENNWLGVIARLKPGITIGQAQAEMNLIRSRLPLGIYGTAEFHERVVSLSEYVVGKELTTILLVLIGAVGFVLLIACANTTNLMLARAVSRRKEMAIRIALGARRWRVIRHALAESLLIGATGGTLGLLIAISGVVALQRFGPDLPRFADVKINGRVLIFTLGLSFVTSLLAGLAPAWQSLKTDLQKSLKDSARTASGGASGRRLRSALVVVEIALSLILLIGAGLMINSLLRLRRVDPGFRTNHILSMRITLPPRLYPGNRATAIVDFFKELEERVRMIPGVELAGYTTNLPLTRFGWMRCLIIEGHPLPRALAETPLVDYRQISPHYFETLGIQMMKGRAINEGDTRNTQPVAVVNESFARQFFPNEEPIGKQFSMVEPETLSKRLTRWTIVGVAKDIKHEGLISEAKPELFSLLEQSLAKADDGPESRMFFVVRAANDPTTLAASVRREVQSLDKEIPVEQIATMDRLLADSLLQQRLIAILLFIFSLIALTLAAAGVYSVMSYSMSQRIHEIGIRMALGAQRLDALKLIIGQGMRLASIGIVIGLMGSLALTRFIKTLLFEVKASDPLTYASIALLIVVVSMLACYLPARRASKVDPLVALKYE
ncbi:MAG: ABC transporter permease [Blastocatellia bacterium]|nr:ABC transporter permease [Blastocatellia bacterium]